ncbi:MAG TPA: DEAD/DEAH box helicase family protein, partial [Ktedonobacterales bacterium]|nr:DEAD/DEAH box helicase family protein [Ktedonobacterales bacterium]
VEFQFDANQEYQLDAIAAVADLFDGQPRAGVEMQFILSAGFSAIANDLSLSDDDILANLRAVQQRSGLAPDAALACIEGEIVEDGARRQVRFPNFSVEMETGTGKTYVYLRTALELHQRYGLRKFIVVVPSVAVREGVLKTLEITEKHLRERYDNVPYRYAVYDSANLAQVRNFALAESVELLVMTLDSFNKAANVIHQSTDRLQGEMPIALVRAARPVLMLDEPQNMESELSVRALATLDPLFALRYSATHRNPYNLVYRLTPFDAYRQRLVKRIEVASVVEHHDPSQAYIRVDDLNSVRNTVTARLAIHKLMKDGTIKEQVVTVRRGDSLRDKAERPEYDGFEVAEIDVGNGFVRFANNVEVRRGDARGPNRAAIFDAQIRYTLEEHFRRDATLRAQGIKVLSLFFLDRVDSYREADGLVRRLFTRAFDELKARYPDWRARDAEQAQAAYFAQRKVTGGGSELVDSVSGKSKDDEAAYDLIMRDKERLLSLDEPVAFIFSHSALREGWDNPNVFQICTLNHTTSEVKKRQEIGRGVRLPVYQSGVRVRDDQVNVLTVVANESYETYVARLQQEIVEEYGVEGLPPDPGNARDRTKRTIRLRKGIRENPDFVALWQKISQKTRYSVTVDSPRLIEDVLPDVDKITVSPPRIDINRARVEVGDDEDRLETHVVAEKTAAYLNGRHPLPNLLDLIDNLLVHTTPSMHLTRRTVLTLLERTSNQKAMLENPHEFATKLAREVKERLADQLAAGIRYERVHEWYDMVQLLEEVQTSKIPIPAKYSAYDGVLCDSETEEKFVDGLEHDDRVVVYIKLPDWFTVATPIGEYNPDWAIVMKETDGHRVLDDRKLYLVRETKSTTDRDKWRPDERRKIECGERHFKDALRVDFDVVTSAKDLP